MDGDSVGRTVELQVSVDGTTTSLNARQASVALASEIERGLPAETVSPAEEGGKGGLAALAVDLISGGVVNALIASLTTFFTRNKKSEIIIVKDGKELIRVTATNVGDLTVASELLKQVAPADSTSDRPT